MTASERARKSILLTGMKHSGKSTLARMLAWEMKAKYLDLDDLIEKAYRSDMMLSCREIFAQQGKTVFMDLERDAAASLAVSIRGSFHVASLGGGTVENIPALEAINGLAVFVYLRVDADVLFARIAKSGIPPFLSLEHPREDFQRLYDKRTILLEKHATITVDLPDDKIEQSQGRLSESIKEYGYAW